MKVRFKIKEIVIVEKEREVELEMEETLEKGKKFNLDNSKDTDFLDDLTEKINTQENPESWYISEQVLEAEVL